jgi:mRNA-degrading endonuclease toxin of MazEF toxin-antitoxin module
MATFPRRGEIWLVEFPDDPKLRPALIVSLDARNEFSNSVLAVPITTNLRPAPTHVLLPANVDWSTIPWPVARSSAICTSLVLPVARSTALLTCSHARD